jgi:PAS domain S-box-containing protein
MRPRATTTGSHDARLPTQLEGDGSAGSIEQRFRTLVEQLPAVVYEAAPGPAGSFHYVSPEIEQVLGYTAQEWMADPGLWLKSLHPADREEAVRLEREHERYAKGRDVRMTGEYRMVARDGRTVFIHDEARLTRVAGGAWVWRGLLIDVTASREDPSEPVALGGDAVRLSCRACGASWTAERRERCRECGSRDVSGISLNATLTALASSKRRAERLVDGIHDHLDELGTFLGSGRRPPPHRGAEPGRE